MHLVIHDASLRKVAFVDNTKQNTLKYLKYEWYRSLETAGSTFTVTIQKKAIQTDNHYEVAYNHLNERSFITFKAKNKTHLFSVMVVTENEETITCECESANLELINEYANQYKATKAMTFVEYCNAMDLLSFTYLTIGLNEVSDKKLTLEWEGQDTKLARLLSLANKFDAEIEFDTRLNADSSIKQFILNVYHKNDDTHQGVGRIREDVQLVYGKNIKSVTRTIDKTNVVNAIRPTGVKDGNPVVISGLGSWEEKNADGVVEFYQKGEMLYAPISMQLYPSTFTHDTIDDQWTRKDITVDSDNPTVVRSEGIKALKRLAYPSITYEVDGFFDGEIGDTVKVIDNGFVPKLILKARVIEQYIYDDETKNKTVLGNFTALENRLSDGIQARLNELVEKAKPYTIKLSTDNGVVFKNNIGQSIVTPKLYKGGKPIVTDVTWRWTLDGNVTTDMTYTVHGADVNDTEILTVSAYVGNDEVATDEVSFTNVFDGTDGQSSYTHIAYANIVFLCGENSSFTLSETALVRYGSDSRWVYKELQAGTYTATNTLFGRDPAPEFTKNVEFIGGFSTSNSVDRAYIGMYVDNVELDSTDPSKYNWTLIKGSDGTQGIPGPKGEDGQTPYVHWAYSDNADGTGLTLTDNGQRYIGHYSDYTQADSTDKTKYRWADRWAKIDVGGVNLLLNSDNTPMDVSDTGNVGLTTSKGDLFSVIPTYNGNIYGFNFSPSETLVNGETYTLSFDVATYTDVSVYWYAVTGGGEGSGGSIPNTNGKVIRYTFKYVQQRDDFKSAFLGGFSNLIAGKEIVFGKFKLEKGNIATDWELAPEDIQANIDSKADQELTQEQLNALNERNQILESEMQAKASMEAFSELEKAYYAFVSKNEKDSAQSEQDLIEASRRIELLTTQFGGLKELKTFIDTYMSSSNEGLIIGKNDASSTIKVSSDRISMFSAGEEVMYISQGVIHIDNGIFTKSLQIGRFRTEQYGLNNDMNVIRYVG